MKIEVSNGEIVDKMSILQIKSEKIKDTEKLKNIFNEIKFIQKDFLSIMTYENSQYVELKRINEMLWQIEDDIREKERNKQFDEDFIELARSVYVTNDQRAKIKFEINSSTDSNLIEEKSYESY